MKTARLTLARLTLVAEGATKTREDNEELAALRRYYGVKHPLDASRLRGRHAQEYRDKLDGLIAKAKLEQPGPVACPHEWHQYGEINGRPYYGCQTCGAERTE